MPTSKVKEAVEKWENKPERGSLMGSLLADRFANDIREALQIFKVSAFLSCERTLLISVMNVC